MDHLKYFESPRMALARDFIKVPLEKDLRSCNDVISVVLMRDTAEVVIKYEPIDWVLYNKFLDMREWTTARPRGPGNYMPALELAGDLLKLNSCGGCALSLFFFSDGKPSDRGDFSSLVGDLASKFGRRLSFTCVGMAESEDDEFSTLFNMVKEAESYGCVASFGRPKLDTDSLSHIVSTLATSLTTTVTEMTDVVTGKMKTVRTDILREKRGTVDGDHLTDDWWKYENQHVVGFYAWNRANNSFVDIMDRRCACCWNESSQNFVCPNCKAVYFCSRSCWNKKHVVYNRQSVICQAMQMKYLSCKISEKEMDQVHSFSVAVKNKYFEEGAERQVRKFRFLGQDQYTFIGPVMVAKESRFIEEEASYDRRLKFHEQFMRTQSISSAYSEKFNEAILKLEDKRVLSQRSPRIEFLKPLLVEVNDKKLKNYCFLIEEMLEGKYEKFNNNKGYVKGQDHNGKFKKSIGQSQISIRLSQNSLSDLVSMFENFSFADEPTKDGLDAIYEGSEDLESDDDSSGIYQMNSIEIYDFPQAFSHFTYQKSKNKLIVVDLQGVLKFGSFGTKIFRLTDPVIHQRKQSQAKNYNFGRTNLGEKGMQAFFATHQCSALCRALGLQEVDSI